MASRIKGITVEIGGDTTGLDKALKSVNTTIKNTQSSLKDVNKLLKLDPSNTELLSQKQKLLKNLKLQYQKLIILRNSEYLLSYIWKMSEKILKRKYQTAFLRNMVLI